MQKLVALLVVTLPALAGTVTDAAVGPGVGWANAYYTPLACCGAPPDPSFISASAEATFTTPGPVTEGFLEVTGLGGGEQPGGAGVSIGGYSFDCGEVGCILPLNGPPMPFTLGVPFEVSVSAFGGYISSETAEVGSGDISFDFSLFESEVPYPGAAPIPGASVAISYDVTSVPEPMTFVPVCLGLLWMASRRQNTPMWHSSVD